MAPIRVELFGVPRVAVGQRAVTVEPAGGTLADVARALASSCPALRGTVLDEASGWPIDGYLFAVDERFTRDPALPVPPGSAVLLVAAAAGGAPAIADARARTPATGSRARRHGA